MKNHETDQFRKARSRLLHRKQELEQQLAAINAALALSDDAEAGAPPPPGAAQSQRCYGDLTGAVMAALSAGPLTKREILAQLAAQEFPFVGRPLKVLDSVVYTKHFARQGRLFSLAKRTQ